MSSLHNDQGLRQELMGEMRQRAAKGASVQELMALVRKRLDLPNENVVPILTYLCRAFGVQLPLVLPVRELVDTEDGAEPYLRALRICFWFSATVQESIRDSESWDWSEFKRRFSSSDIEKLEEWESTPTSRIEGRISEQFEESVYVRGLLELQKDKLPISTSDKDIQHQIKDFAGQWHNRLRSRCYGKEGKKRLGFWFEIKDQGPFYQLTCCVECMVDRIATATPSAVAVTL